MSLKFSDIEPDLKQGKHVVIKNIDKEAYKIVLPLVDSVGKYLTTVWCTEIKVCIDTFYELIPIELDDEFKFHSYYIPKYEMPKVGDKMYVLPEAERELKKTDGWNEGINRFIGKIVIIENIDGGECLVCLKEGSKSYWILISCLGYLKPCEEEKGHCCCNVLCEGEVWTWCPFCGKKLNK